MDMICNIEPDVGVPKGLAALELREREERLRRMAQRQKEKSEASQKASKESVTEKASDK